LSRLHDRKERQDCCPVLLSNRRAGLPKNQPLPSVALPKRKKQLLSNIARHRRFGTNDNVAKRAVDERF
jgi:hypothetical protein